ncbi:hypothetical protein ACWEQL_19245 [Kitasatospora sp. NPDC004240]
MAYLFQTRVPGTPSWSPGIVILALIAAVLTGLGPLAEWLARRQRLFLDRVRAASTSGWVNGLLVYGFAILNARTTRWISLGAALATWLLTTLTVCRLLTALRPWWSPSRP